MSRMSHEGEDLHMVKLHNQVLGGSNRGNEWWIFAHDGTPVETWSSKARAKCFALAHNEFRARYSIPPVFLCRCLPGVGFIPQEDAQ